MFNYTDIFSRLTYDTAVITFLKKDGTIRIMLCTRNLSTVGLIHGFKGWELAGHDKRCSVKNGNLAVIDMIIGEPRSFQISRVLDVQYAGIIDSIEKFNEVVEKFTEYKDNYEKTMPMEIGLDTFDNNSVSGGVQQ